MGILQEGLPNVQYTYDNYTKKFHSRLQSSYELAKKNLIAKKDCRKEYHDKNVNISLFTVGDKVYYITVGEHRHQSKRRKPSGISGEFEPEYS
jgi:hypothetical protein